MSKKHISNVIPVDLGDFATVKITSSNEYKFKVLINHVPYILQLPLEIKKDQILFADWQLVKNNKIFLCKNDGAWDTTLSQGEVVIVFDHEGCAVVIKFVQNKQIEVHFVPEDEAIDLMHVDDFFPNPADDLDIIFETELSGGYIEQDGPQYI